MVCTTPPSQDASTLQIWNSYLREYRRYAPNSMLILETRSGHVTVTQGWYATLCHLGHPKMHPHTKFGIPTSNNMRYAQETIILKTRSEVKVTVTHKRYMTLRHPKMNPHTKFRFLPRYALDTIILKTRSRSQWHENGTQQFLPQIIREICSGRDYSKN